MLYVPNGSTLAMTLLPTNVRTFNLFILISLQFYKCNYCFWEKYTRHYFQTNFSENMREWINITWSHVFTPLYKYQNCKAGRTRTDKIGVGAGADIRGTGISCNFIARQYMGPTWQSYRDDHRHVGAMPATPSINRPAFSHLYARRGSVVQLSVPR